MIQVCLKDGFVVFEFASAAEYVKAFPDGLRQAADMGAFVALSDKEANDVAFERRQVNNKKDRFQRLPQASGFKRNRSISELMVEKD